MRTMFRHSSVPALLLCIAACAPAAGGGASGTRVQPGGGDRAAVEVLNDGSTDVVVFLMRGSERYRLGYVSRMATVYFRVPNLGAVGSTDLRLVAQPVTGGQVLSTGSFLWRSGQSMRARVGRTMTSQSFDVWIR